MYPDVVIIGGGIVGCSCAYYLSREGLKVHLLEKGALGSGASKAGQSHIVTWEEPEIHLRLSNASKQLYEVLSEELPIDIEFETCGSIALFEHLESFQAYEETADRLRAWGVSCEMVDADELIRIEPTVAPDIAGGTIFPGDCQANPLYTTIALARVAEDQGAVVETSAEVTGIELSSGGGRVEAVRTAAKRIPTGCVVNAAGAWSGQIGEMVGLNVPVTPRKGHLVVTVPVPQDLFTHKVVLAASYMDSLKEGLDVALAANVQQMQNGNLLLGSSRQFTGFDRSVEPKVIGLMVARCLRFFPSLAGIHAIRTWAGLRPYTPDLLPIIGPVEELEGFYMAAGHEGIGVTEGPITGKLISQMLTGADLDVPVDELSLSRFFSNGTAGDTSAP